jgi:cytoskeletal protein RodZ
MTKRAYLAAITLIIGVAMAQEPNPADANRQNPPNNPPAATETQRETTTTTTTTTTAQTSRPPEAKTQTYKGTLVDASCATPGTVSSTTTTTTSTASKAERTTDASTKSSTETSATTETTTADRGAATADTGKAKRDHPAAADQACTPSASSAAFALKLEDGRVVKFDSVGNMRAQEAFKNKKKWQEMASSGKPIHVKASGMMSDDKLVVMSVN